MFANYSMLSRLVRSHNSRMLLLSISASTSKGCLKIGKLEHKSVMQTSLILLSLLGELDGDLMLELDEVVRQNQLACLPTSKSGRAEVELLETYPWLADRIERGKGIKVDSVSLQTRLHEPQAKFVGGSKAKAAFLEDFDQSTSSQKLRPRSSKEGNSQSKSPSLKPKSSAADLMFDMDEESDSDTENRVKSSLDQHQRSASRANDTLPPSSLPTEAEAPDDEETVFAKDDHLIAVSTTPLSYQNTVGGSAGSPLPLNSKKPWGPPALPTPKLEMKDIMAQDSSKRVSNISAAFSLRGKEGEASSAGLPARLSQRERKQQQQQRALLPKHVPASSPAADEQTQRQQPASPWQVASKGPRISLKDVIGCASSESPPQVGSMARTPSPMTLRQTISGKAAPARRAVTGPAQSPLPTPKRSISTPDTSHLTSQAPLPPSRSSSSQTPIQSIRHIAPPVEPTLQLSMADILSQQQTEKEIIKEAAAKRSLQEIQEEQAFQEWWDEESRKVKAVDEVAAAAKPAPRGGKGMRGKARGGSRGRGRGKSGGGGGGEASQSTGGAGTSRTGGERGGEKAVNVGQKGRKR